MFATQLEAETRYKEYRSEVFKYVKKSLDYPDSQNISLKDIDATALLQARLWDQ